MASHTVAVEAFHPADTARPADCNLLALRNREHPLVSTSHFLEDKPRASLEAGVLEAVLEAAVQAADMTRVLHEAEEDNLQLPPAGKHLEHRAGRRPEHQEAFQA